VTIPGVSSSTGNTALDVQLFYAGRGVAKSADLGRDSPAQGKPVDVFCGLQHVAGADPSAKGNTANPYFHKTPFGDSKSPDKGGKSTTPCGSK